MSEARAQVRPGPGGHRTCSRDARAPGSGSCEAGLGGARRWGGGDTRPAVGGLRDPALMDRWGRVDPGQPAVTCGAARNRDLGEG